jgi:hypothetical protein
MVTATHCAKIAPAWSRLLFVTDFYSMVPHAQGPGPGCQCDSSVLKHAKLCTESGALPLAAAMCVVLHAVTVSHGGARRESEAQPVQAMSPLGGVSRALFVRDLVMSAKSHIVGVGTKGNATAATRSA